MVRLAALREAPHAFGSTYEREAGASEEMWRERLVQRTRFIAEVEAEAAGTVSGGDSTSRGVAAITAMWVDPRFRGKGVGDALVTAVLDWARDRRYRDVVLCVRAGNARAERLYERHGFARTGALCAGDPDVEYEMGRRL